MDAVFVVLQVSVCRVGLPNVISSHIITRTRTFGVAIPIMALIVRALRVRAVQWHIIQIIGPARHTVDAQI